MSQNIKSFCELFDKMSDLPAGPANLDTSFYACPGEIVLRVITGGNKLCKILAYLAVDFHNRPVARGAWNGFEWITGRQVWWDKDRLGRATIDPGQGQYSGYPGMPADKKVQMVRLRYLRRQTGKPFEAELYSNGKWVPFQLIPENLADSVNSDLPVLLGAMELLKQARLALFELVEAKERPESVKRQFISKVQVTMPKSKPAEPDHCQAFALEAAAPMAPEEISNQEDWKPEFAGVLNSEEDWKGVQIPDDEM